MVAEGLQFGVRSHMIGGMDLHAGSVLLLVSWAVEVSIGVRCIGFVLLSDAIGNAQGLIFT